MLISQTYGTIENHWKKRIKKTVAVDSDVTVWAKIKYLLKRFYPSHQHMITWCQTEAPFCYRHRWLMPLARIKRKTRLNKDQRHMIRREVKTICQSK